MTKTSRKKSTPKKNPTKRSGAKRFNLDELTRAVVKLFAANPTHTWNYKQVSKQLDITEQPMRQTISRILEVLEMDDTLTRVKPGTYR